MSDSQVIQGGCLCGAVRYEAAGHPYDITHCHCVDCRRSSGAAFVTWASFKTDEFCWSKGEPKIVAWADRLRSFCGECGTPLTFRSAPDSAEIDVTVCTFDHPESVSPEDHTWTQDRLPWIHPADGLPQYPAQRHTSS